MGGDFTQTVHVVDFQIHQSYVDDGKFMNDICLLQLSQNVKSTPDVAPICCPRRAWPTISLARVTLADGACFKKVAMRWPIGCKRPRCPMSIMIGVKRFTKRPAPFTKI